MSKMFQATLCKHKVEVEFEGEWLMFANLTDWKLETSANIETWNPMEAMGASVSEKTAVDQKFNGSAYRTYGATVNDKVAATFQKMLDDVKFNTRWTTPDGEVYTFVGVYNTTAINTGTTKDLDKMDFEVYPYGLLNAGTSTAYTE